jgi:hypothetical protein
MALEEQLREDAAYLRSLTTKTIAAVSYYRLQQIAERLSKLAKEEPHV